MPILKLIRYKSGTDFRPSVMRNVMGYCLQPSKTKIREEIFSVTGQNCVPAIAYNQFMATKASWGKTDGLLFRHYVQSFSPDENISPLQANEIVGEFAAKAWAGYEVLIATHVDRAHIHSHMIVNTVHPDTGKKLHESPDNLKKLRAISDEICRSHGIVTLPPYRKTKVHGVGNGEYRKAIRGESWKFRLCGAITLAMVRSLSREDFIEAMRLQGYGVRWEDGRKQITYTCYRDGKCKDGSYRKCRDNRLHDEKFLKENMEYEFIIRQNLCKALARRADETEYAGADSGRNGTRERADRQPAGNGFADAGYGFGTRPAGSTDTGDTQRDGSPAPEGLADDRKFAEGDENTAPRQRTTGWESARPDFFADRKIQSPGSHYPMGAQHSVRPAKPAHSGIGDLAGIASAVSILNNGDSEESEEEKREREARENGNAIGAVVGYVAGLLSALDPDCDENSDETESEENTFGLFM